MKIQLYFYRKTTKNDKIIDNGDIVLLKYIMINNSIRYGGRIVQRELNKEHFEKYFFYGLENKGEIIKWIIATTAKRLQGTHVELDDKNGKMRYEIDQEAMLELIVQLERFTTLHDDPEHREYFYDRINTNSTRVHQLFNQMVPEIKNARGISFVTWRPVSGIYFNTHSYPEQVCRKYKKFSGERYIQYLREEPNSAWGEEVLDILYYLKELEKENKIEYYSLFLDTKYARAIDRNIKRNNR